MRRYLLPVSVQSRVSIKQALSERGSYLPKRALLIPLSVSSIFVALTGVCMLLAYTTDYNGLFALLTAISCLFAGVSWLALDAVRRAW